MLEDIDNAKEQKELWEISEAYKAIARSPEGQMVLADLVRRFGWTRSTLLNTDPLRMAWNEGTRAVVVHIGRMVDMEIDEADDTTAARGID